MITKIGKQRKEYPDHKTIKFLTLGDYLKIAQRIIGHFANTIQPGLANKMLRSEDAISYVAHDLMLGHWDWTPDGGRTFRSHLNQRGIWSIKDYVSRARNKTNRKLRSLNESVGNPIHKTTQLGDTIADHKAKEPHAAIIDADTKEELKKRLEESGLTGPQRTYLLLFVDGMSYSDIAKELGVSRQNVQQMVQAAVRKCQATGV
jgi:RNA polymerase sigma factor (sigma-70 family)